MELMTQTPPHYAVILRAEERIFKDRPQEGHPPLHWNTRYLAALGTAASETRMAGAKDWDRYFRAAAAGAAAVALAALRCVLRDEWEFPEMDPMEMPPRLRLPAGDRGGALGIISGLDNPAAMALPVHIDEALAECGAAWAAWMAAAETVRDLHTGRAEGSALWRRDRHLQEVDLGQMLESCADAAAAAFDFCGRAELDALLFV